MSKRGLVIVAAKADQLNRGSLDGCWSTAAVGRGATHPAAHLALPRSQHALSPTPCIAADCSKQCQESHWPLHKRECARLRQAAEDNRVPEEQVYGKSRGRGGSGAGGGSSAAAGSGGASSSGAGEVRLVRPMCGLCGNRKVRGSLTDRACV